MPEITNDKSFGVNEITNNKSFGVNKITNNKTIKGTNSFGDNAFIITVDSTNTGVSDSNQFTLPLTQDNTDLYVLTDEGNLINITDYTTQSTITFESAGEHTLRIVTLTGTFQGFQFNNGGDRLKLTNVSQCGCLDISTNAAFFGCSNMTWTATDAPTISTAQMTFTFRDCTNFNGAIGNWDIVGVTALSSMFLNASSFNQPIGTWNTSTVTNLFYALNGCSNFDQDLSNWDVSNVTNATLFLNTATLSTANYDAILIGWEATLEAAYPSGVGSPNVTISFGNSQYTLGGAAEAARDSLINTFGWTITDGGGDGAATAFNTAISQAYNDGNRPVLGANAVHLNTLLNGLDSDGILAKLDILRIYAAGGDANFALYNFVDATTFAATAVNSPTFTSSEGWTGDGVSAYIDWNWSPDPDGVNYTLNSACFGYYGITVNTSKVAMGARTSASPLTGLTYATGAGEQNIFINTDNVSNSATGQNTDTGLRVFNRSASNAIQKYINGVLTGSGANISSEMTTQNFYDLALNNVGSAIFNDNSQRAISFAGASLDATEHANLNTAITTYLTAIGAI